MSEWTLAQDNEYSIRLLQNSKETDPDLWGKYQEKRLEERLKDRDLYSSDEPMTVWVLECCEIACRPVLFLSKEELKKHLQEYYSEDGEVVDCEAFPYHTEAMTGREFGSLLLVDL